MGCGLGWFVELWIQSFYFAIGWFGLGQSFGGLGWVGLKKLDPRTTLMHHRLHLVHCQRKEMLASMKLPKP